MLRFVTELVRISELFKQHNIPMITFKGPVLSMQLYGDINSREPRDLDIFIHKQNIDKAKLFLEQEGYCVKHPDTPLSPKQWLTYKSRAKDISLYHPEKKVHIDLHWRWVHIPDMFNPGEAVWEAATEIEIANRKLKTLSPEYNLLYLCMHSSKHAWLELHWMCDVAALLQQKDDWGWPQLLEQAKHLHIERCLAEALCLCHEIFHYPIPSVIQTYIDQDRKVKWLVKITLHMLQKKPNRGLIFLSELLLTRSWRSRLAITLHLDSSLVGTWKRYPLPEKLYSLYYLIFPVDFAYRTIRSIVQKIRA